MTSLKRLSEVPLGQQFMTTVTNRPAVKLQEYSFNQGGTWIKLGKSRHPAYHFEPESMPVHNMLVLVE